MKLPTQKCERTVLPKGAFHPQSFRWTHPAKDLHLLIGCPKVLDRGGRKIPTKWVSSGRNGTQCRVASSGAKAGTRVHAIVRPAKAGKCEKKYGRR